LPTLQLEDRVLVQKLLPRLGVNPGVGAIVVFHPPEALLEAGYDRQAALYRLTAQAPMWPPGTASGYSPIAIGFLAGELFRIVDGRSMGTALREDFAGPYDLDLWIGLPDSEHWRVAEMRKPARAVDLGTLDDIKRAAFFDKGSSPGGRASSEWRRIEIPSANLHGTARDLARIMGVIATGGLMDGRRTLSPGVAAQATRQRVHGQDRVLPFVMGWAAGLTMNEGLDIFGPNPGAVGHCGWGGSCAFADPETRVSAGYVMTRQSPHLIGDPRAQRLIAALYSGL
jgi:CubicO group peptidase (beta-lactamase class C family)